MASIHSRLPAHESSLHYRPPVGRLCDTIPFFDNGVYHLFYLLAEAADAMTWEHAVSTDLVHWRNLPRVLERNPDDPEGPDGFNMFTGCVVADGGTYHAFYTGHNPSNRNGSQMVCHAVSADLITWRKIPEHTFAADGVRYLNNDFRDPHVFRHEDGSWRMLLCADEPRRGFSLIGTYRSDDLLRWTPAEPLILDPMPLEGETGAPECPDVFALGEHYYLLYTRRGQNIRRSRKLEGPYSHNVPSQLDSPRLLAGKSLYDGRRHVYFGPLSGDFGDTVCSLARELYRGPDGYLRCRPADEYAALFDVDSFVATDAPMLYIPADGLSVPTPETYMVECDIEPVAGGVVHIGFRGGGDPDRRAAIDHDARAVTVEECTRSWGDEMLVPIRIRAFVSGSVVEFFVNDTIGLTSRDYGEEHTLRIEYSGKASRILRLVVRSRSGGALAGTAARE